MTVNQAIEQIDRLKPNRFTEANKLHWLSELDGMVVKELFDTHENSPLEGEFKPYTEADLNKELLVEYPYDSVYQWYLESKIDLHNGEVSKYNNSKTLFNNSYLTYTDHYNRTHMPRRIGFKFTERRRREV